VQVKTTSAREHRAEAKRERSRDGFITANLGKVITSNFGIDLKSMAGLGTMLKEKT
jgi:hypothetical protein